MSTFLFFIFYDLTTKQDLLMNKWEESLTNLTFFLIKMHFKILFKIYILIYDAKANSAQVRIVVESCKFQPSEFICETFSAENFI